MRVLVEILGKEPIDNLLSTSIFEPEIVVYLCDQQETGFFRESTAVRFLKRRKVKTQPRFYYFDSSNPSEVNRVLAAIVKDYPGCVFDFSGGKDIILLLAGVFCEKNKVPGFYLDLRKKRLINIYGCEELQARFKIPSFTVEDIFALSGAAVHGYGHFEPKNLDEEFEQDALTVWEIVSQNPKAWSEFVAYLQACCSGSASLTTKMECRKVVHTGKYIARYNPAILSRLYAHGILLNYIVKQDTVLIEFKSPLYKRCLLNQGIWLELFCYVTAKRSGYFSDVRTSVVVDWDAEQNGLDTTKNEVDVMLVNGVVPVFISCKMSVPPPLALSEIKLLSMKFGGSLSKTVLVTAAGLTEENKALLGRAKDLGILMVDRTLLDAQTLPKKLLEMTLAP